MAPCQSCHTAGELFAEVGTISRLGNPFVFFSMDNNHNRHNQQKIIFFVYYQRLALTIFHVTGVSASLRPTFWLA